VDAGLGASSAFLNGIIFDFQKKPSAVKKTEVQNLATKTPSWQPSDKTIVR